MTNSKRSLARQVGGALLLMGILAGFSYGYVHGTLIVPEGPATTLENIRSFRGLFAAEIAGWVLIFLLDILVAWALYLYFAEVQRAAASTMAWMRVLYAVVLGLAIWNLVSVLQLAGNTDTETAALVTARLEGFNLIWSRGLILFGLHLMVLGYLAFRAAWVPQVWGILLFIAGLSYFLVHSGYAIFPGRKTAIELIEAVLVLPMMVGEIGFAFWLLFAGGKAEKG